MSRARVAWLLLLSALLVSDGESPAPPDRPLDGGSVVFTEARVGSLLDRLNPELTDNERARIAAAVVKYSARYELDPALVLAIIRKESAGRPWVRSSKGAVGLMQVMPHMMGVLPVAGNLTSIESNIEAGCMILADNIRRLGEDQGIAAYFWGNDVRNPHYRNGVEKARAEILAQAAES